MHLAQLNIGRPLYANDDPRFAGFMDNLERINKLGASMPGFVWIHKDDSGHAMDMPTPWPDMAANLTVWETAEDLERFVWNTVHARFYNRKPNGSRRWTMPISSCGGWKRGTGPRYRKLKSGSIICRRMATAMRHLVGLICPTSKHGARSGAGDRSGVWLTNRQSRRCVC